MNKSTKIRLRSVLTDNVKLLGLIASLGCASATAATLAPGVQQKLSSATFEVVLAKPVSDPLTYEKPLPLELIPYRERMDKFQSIGTAFAIGPNRFVSAAHVISAGNGSQYGPLCLRNAAGTTYRIDKIIKYSNSEDYVVFSVLAAPVVVALETRSRPPLNTPVFAVGNALGEGVVVRDGLYTSDTPEELEGRWQWLRFSAAASPGNSGGPLIDRNGKVVGVVVRKSPNENLNFALAIGQVLDGSQESGLLEARSSYHTMVMKATDSISLNEKDSATQDARRILCVRAPDLCGLGGESPFRLHEKPCVRDNPIGEFGTAAQFGIRRSIPEADQPVRQRDLGARRRRATQGAAG